MTSVEIAGRPDLKTSDFQSKFAQKEGQPFAREKVEATAAALRETGRFQKVRIQVEPLSNGLRVLYVLEPAVWYGIFQFPGAERYPYSRLIQVSNYTSQAPYDSATVEQDRQRLLRFFRQEGYFKADVTTSLQTDTKHGVVNVIFHSDLGKKAKFGDVNITGVSPAQQKELHDQITGPLARFRGAAVRHGKAYKRPTLNKATNRLESHLQKKGYLAAQVKLSGAEFHADTNRADIQFNADPGTKTKVEIQGARLFPWTKKTLLPVYQGVGVDPETVAEGEQALSSYYQKKGYFDIKVSSETTGNDQLRTVVYRIAKGKKHSVTDVHIAGEQQLKADDLTPHIAVQKKHFLSHGQFSDQLVRASIKNLKGVYESQGFSNVQVTSNVIKHGGDIEVTFHVTEGPRDVVTSLAIQGASTFPESQFAPKGLKLAEGQPYSQANVQADRAGIMANYFRAGYLTASFRETATQVSKNDPHHINVIYHIYEGPRVFTGDVLTLGRNYTRQRLIDQDVNILKPDEPLTETNLLTAGSSLYDHTGVFDWAEVDPRTQITTQTSEDVLIKVHEAKRNDFTYGFGFELINRGGSIPSGTAAVPNLPPVGLPSNFKTSQTTFYGPRGSFQYTRNNFRGKGESVTFTAFAGRLDQRLGLFYINPNFRWTPWKSTFSFTYERNEQNPIFSSQQDVGSYQIQRFIDEAKHNLFFVRYSFSKTDLTRVEIPELVPPEDQHVRLSGFGANLTRDSRDNVLDAHKGVLDSIELDLNSTKLGSSVNFAKLTSQAAIYREKFHNIVWAGSIRVGLAQPFANSRVPLSERFFTGGGDSLRGFPLDGAGPQRNIFVCSSNETAPNCPQINVPSGGNEQLIINAEARIPLPIKKGIGIVPFYDGGNVFPRIGFHDFTSLYANNIGIGLRYATPVGPIRFDFGYNLNAPKGVKSTQPFISIGQAF
ncbi:outer membrane protein assembly factor [Occallatibacter savannae]|uniref:outer membrane protein assembly factor n=1 Tax=Occallatibacter savannae TaxID=1002691 RepID=UPI0013A58DC8|nr:outer membrane protein assembly factor [Occallatibacter savannae]